MSILNIILAWFCCGYMGSLFWVHEMMKNKRLYEYEFNFAERV